MKYFYHDDGRIDIIIDTFNHDVGTIFTRDEEGVPLVPPFFITSGGVTLYPSDLKEIAEKIEELS